MAATVASFFCVDEASIAYLGRSDGGLIAKGIPAYVPGQPRAAQHRRERHGHPREGLCFDGVSVNSSCNKWQPHSRAR